VRFRAPLHTAPRCSTVNFNKNLYNKTIHIVVVSASSPRYGMALDELSATSALCLLALHTHSLVTSLIIQVTLVLEDSSCDILAWCSAGVPRLLWSCQCPCEYCRDLNVYIHVLWDLRWPKFIPYRSIQRILSTAPGVTDLVNN
jgi:hypothetical protein